MKLSTKHQNQEKVMFGDVSGGLNTETAEEFIGQNQACQLVNMEIDSVTGQLRTVKGTKNILKLAPTYTNETIKSAEWDAINGVLVIFTELNNIYVTNTAMTSIYRAGVLTASGNVSVSSWEDGIIIASGGKLQYGKMTWVTNRLTGISTEKYIVSTIVNSPDVCRYVFVRSGRVIVFDDEDTLYYSGVGDEENWTQDSNDPSASLFIQAGYKVGGKLKAAYNLSSDVLLIKDNGLCMRLSGEYPDWSISEVSRHVYTMNQKSLCGSGGSSVMCLGLEGLQVVSTTQDYGNIKPDVIGQQVKRLIMNMDKCTVLRYIPTFNQIWFMMQTQTVLVHDLSSKSFFTRVFNSEVSDAVCVGRDVYIIKKDRIDIIDYNESKFKDDNEPLEFRLKLKTDVATNDLLIKKVALCITPLKGFYEDTNGTLVVGRITLPFPIREKASYSKQTIGITQTAKELSSTFINDGDNDVMLDQERLQAGKTITLKSRQICRGDRARVVLKGSGLPFILNWISYDKVEV